jgi:hypothetical protein
VRWAWLLIVLALTACGSDGAWLFVVGDVDDAGADVVQVDDAESGDVDDAGADVVQVEDAESGDVDDAAADVVQVEDAGRGDVDDAGADVVPVEDAGKCLGWSGWPCTPPGGPSYPWHLPCCEGLTCQSHGGSWGTCY